MGLDPKFGKTFDKDIFFVDYLQKLSPTIHIGTLFKQIQEAKFDTSTLGTAEHLIKDYKQWSTENGISYGIIIFFFLNCFIWYLVNYVQALPLFCYLLSNGYRKGRI